MFIKFVLSSAITRKKSWYSAKWMSAETRRKKNSTEDEMKSYLYSEEEEKKTK